MEKQEFKYRPVEGLFFLINNLSTLINEYEKQIKSLNRKQLLSIMHLPEDFEKLKEQGEFKDDIEDVEKQALNLIEIAIDKDKYKGIVGNY